MRTSPAGESRPHTPIYTIGHSTHSLADVEDQLRAAGVDVLVDIRSFPGSRHCPQWNQENILAESDIHYRHLPLLGGKRRKVEESGLNNAWRNQSFKNYAEYMQTDEFRQGMEDLQTLARIGGVAIMCAEAVPWKCHRSMVTDALIANGWEVHDIIGSEVSIASMHVFAQVEDDGRITYPATVKDSALQGA